ncbi:hypothetical protein [Microbacterium hydrocarbonoxydans]|uniref:hypothetical protein n=1 Tax=Microbacterium hydrocarbonoxydans TaxID=273678 RepID=UPI00203C61B9|nr:hypothetical protein [Microbacterium hydrocarbonoxydans]MCM3778526.1 hypothetical protein [Microbacterium hydrocarbonoxydans]
MQDLLGRLTALDPDASESLKVVTYFDALVARSVGVESMLRGAAVLSGATVGLRDGSQIVRVAASGERIGPTDPDESWMQRESGQDAVVWIERDGEPRTNDAMILERLALALGIVRARRSVGAESAVELAISSYASVDERASALLRLRMTDAALCVVASPPDPAPLPQHPSSVVATRHGLTRATIVDAASDPSSAWSESAPRLGVGLTGPGVELPDSWAAALIAVRLTSEAEPAVRAADLGAALIVAEAADGAPLHPDAVVLRSLDPRTLDLLDALAEERSVRGAAARLGRHHSSIQERLATVIDVLGYDPRTARGHTRYALARMLCTLAD